MRTFAARSKTTQPPLEVLDLDPPAHDIRAEVLSGLKRPQKHLPCKLLYDQRGSRLFDEICRLPEYYPTRTELGILRRHAEDIARDAGPHARLVEFGSGSSIKTRLLLEAMEQLACYVPIDISRAHLLDAAAAIARDYPHIPVLPVLADYTRPLQLPDPGGDLRSTCGFFPGSTIGNFEPDAATAFLKRIARLVGPGGALVIGFDLHKDRTVLEKAYNDPAGVTAAFNRNIMRVINREVDADFCEEDFAHRAVYDDRARRIEMRLISLRDQQVRFGAQHIAFGKGEYIITEYSHKYRLTDIAELAEQAGFRTANVWRDPDALFAVCYLTAAREPPGRPISRNPD